MKTNNFGRLPRSNQPDRSISGDGTGAEEPQVADTEASKALEKRQEKADGRMDHNASPRNGGELSSSIGWIPENLMESELSVMKRSSRVQSKPKRTLNKPTTELSDEATEMSQMYRCHIVSQEGEFERASGTKTGTNDAGHRR